MKSFAVLCCVMLLVGPGRAERTSTQLTKANLNDQQLSFTIKVDPATDTKKVACLRFHVTVKANAAKAPLSPRRWGYLQVFDGDACISACRLEPSERDGAISYSFEVASKYTAKSEFGYYEDLSAPGGRPAGRYHWFYLEEFVAAAEEKKPGPEGRRPLNPSLFAGARSGAKADQPRPGADPITPEMRQALQQIGKIHGGMDQGTIDDAVEALHRDISRFDRNVFVPLAVPYLLRLAPRDTQTRIVLRRALANGWMDPEFTRACLVQAGDTPEPHIRALVKALDDPDPKVRTRAARSLGTTGAAGAPALPKLREIVAKAKADPADFDRAYTIHDQMPEHVVAHVAILQIEGSAGADEAEDRAIAAIEKLGGKVTRDPKKAGSPAIAVDLRSRKVSDKDLESVQGLKAVESLVLSNNRITDAALCISRA